MIVTALLYFADIIPSILIAGISRDHDYFDFYGMYLDVRGGSLIDSPSIGRLDRSSSRRAPGIFQNDGSRENGSRAGPFSLRATKEIDSITYNSIVPIVIKFRPFDWRLDWQLV